MAGLAALPPIPGRVIDPPPREAPGAVLHLDDDDGAAGLAVGVGYRALSRFNHARSTVLAAGTTYYVFLAMFSLIALGYGITALFGAERIADYLTQAISEAFPGLLGEDGIDPAQLRSIGQAASIIGLVVMLYAGSGAMVAASSSIHLIYGAPPDPRNYVVKRIRLLGWLLVIGPLIAFSFVAVTFTLNFADRVGEAIGMEGTGGRYLVGVVAVVVAIGADYLVVRLMLSRTGGIRPPSRALVIGSVTGAVVLQLLRVPMSLILELTVDKPQYGALTVPISLLLILYLNSTILYAAAALTAGVADREVPLDEILPTPETEQAKS